MSGDINCKSNFVSYVLADVIIFVYEVPFIFWHYINVDESKLNHSQKIFTQCDGIITNCDGRLLQIATAFLVQSATRFITNCDRYYEVRWIYYKLQQVLQSGMIITNCDSTVFHSNFRHRIEAIKVVESKAKPNCFSTSFSR